MSATDRRGFLASLLALPVVARLLPKKPVQGNYVTVREYFDTRTNQGWRQIRDGPKQFFYHVEGPYRTTVKVYISYYNNGKESLPRFVDSMDESAWRAGAPVRRLTVLEAGEVPPEMLR